MIEHILQLPEPAIPYGFGRYLAERHPERALLEAMYAGFDFVAHAATGAARIVPHAGVYHRWISHWNQDDKTVRRDPAILSASVTWNNHDLELYVLAYDMQQLPLLWISAATQSIAEAYYGEVTQWSAELRGEILVFEGGCFTKNDDLYRDIKAATFENLILAGALKSEIQADFNGFFASRDLYADYNIPWKRGILFIGPPGNGKTHAVKALLNAASCACLYVKTFDLPHGQFPQAGVSAVFERARRSTPCIVVLEDLDSLVGDHNRSFFLNELDGFAANNGVVVLATTNHPERLDPAILDRPSRFDRKYLFDLPAQSERERYLRQWNASLPAPLSLDEPAIIEIAEKAEGFSFAYLRELFLCASVRWISDGRAAAFGAVMLGQVDALRDQMTLAPEDDLGTQTYGGDFRDASMSPQQMMAMRLSAQRSFGGGWNMRP